MKKIILSGAILAMSFISNVNAQFFESSNRLVGSFNSSQTTSSTFNNVNTSTRYQNGYTRKDGTFVTGHMKTTSNGTNLNNYSTRSNVNPYTGTTGSRAQDYSTQSYNYGFGNTIHTGSRGGQYYINSNGNKTYVPKRNRF